MNPAELEINPPEVKAGPAAVRGGILSRLLRRGGIDRAVGFTILGRSWSALSGFMTLFLMTRFMSPVLQGYYYTFGSVLALAIFFELGLSAVLMQFASHERGALEWTAAGTVEGDPAAKERLSSLLHMSMRWYGVIGFLFVAMVLPAGLLFFGKHDSEGLHWQLPWVWVSIVSGLTILLTPPLAVLEGCGMIVQITRMQMWQGVVGSLCLWLTLTLHGGLYAMPVAATATLVWQVLWLLKHRRGFYWDLLALARRSARTGLSARVDWRGEIWPVQWRMALSYMSGYFIFQMFTPVLFATHGKVVAGQMGLSATVMGSVATIAIAWMSTKSATFGTLLSRRDYGVLDRLFFPALWQSWGLCMVGGAAVWLMVFVFHALHWKIAHRFLPLPPLALLIGATVINHGVFAEAIYLRAHKREPFLVQSLAVAAAVAASTLLLGRPFGATGMMAGYFVVSLGGLVSATVIFRRLRCEWHAEGV